MLHLKDSHHANQAASTPSLFTVCRLESNTWRPTNLQPSPPPKRKKLQVLLLYMNVYEWMDAQLTMSFRGLYFNIFLTRRVCELTNGYLIKESGKDVSSYMINYSWILFTDTVSMNSDFDHLIVPSSFYAHYKWKINKSRWQKIPEYLLVLTFFPFGNSTLKDHVNVEKLILKHFKDEINLPLLHLNVRCNWTKPRWRQQLRESSRRKQEMNQKLILCCNTSA